MHSNECPWPAYAGAATQEHCHSNTRDGPQIEKQKQQYLDIFILNI